MSDDDGDYMDPSQWRLLRGPAPVVPPSRRSRLLGRRHMIDAPLQPEPIPCYCPIARDHNADEFYAQGRR
jgi:hypothetical protein